MKRGLEMPGAPIASDPKKAKTDPKDPSKVVHMRNIPADATEDEVRAQTKHQAFIQMDSLESAIGLVTYYNVSPNMATIRGKPVYLQFSNHQEITSRASSGQAADNTDHAAAAEQPSRVLLVAVMNMHYTVTLDLLHTLFSRFGPVLRIVIFTKRGFQALVELASVEAASAAKAGLDNVSIYPGVCHMRIHFSNLQELRVSSTDRSRDYTLNPAPAASPAAISLMQQQALMAAQQRQFADGAAQQVALQMQAAPQVAVQPPQFIDPAVAVATALQPQLALGGQVGQLAAVQPRGAGSAMAGPFVGVWAAHQQAMATGGMHVGPIVAPAGIVSPFAADRVVLIVSNLDPEKITCDQLFTLFGVYGDVQRVKILFNKKDTALVQMFDNMQADQAMQNLQKAPLHGRQISINYSRHAQIMMPRESSEPGQDLTRDYSQSTLHRYKIRGSKNFQHICPPSRVLHVSNIAATASQEELEALFAAHGEPVRSRFFPKDRRMALVEMPSVETAILALVALHDYRIGSTPLRVSFSRTTF
eukprot:m51a1_g5744 hypothetical protein (532) ;mRNA; r:1166823-1168876